MDLTLKFDDTGSHLALLETQNLDGTVASGVSKVYSSSDPTVATIDPSTGALTLLAVGTTAITGTGARGAFTHALTGVLTLVEDANTGDFTAVLDLV